MTIYTLEQVLNDPSLAIITDNITTLRELNMVYVNYKVLSRKQRRISNYYSNKFLGSNVPDMYDMMKDRLMAGYDDLFEDLPLPSESYVHSEPDLYYKENSFNAGETNICFVLGHSGSGKSRMSRILEGDDIDRIELDDLLLIKDHFTMDELKDYSDMLYSFFNSEGAKYYIGIQERESIPKEEYEDKVFIDFVNYAMDYAKQHPEKKFIIDGIWLYLYFDDPSVFSDYAVFIKGTSFLKSKIRAMKREAKRDPETLEKRKQMFGREVRNYLLDEEKINSYRTYYADSPDTILREETADADRKADYVLGQLNRIDQLFINDDADGIREIMHAAETNDELSAINKLRIIEECQSAIFELRI